MSLPQPKPADAPAQLDHSPPPIPNFTLLRRIGRGAYGEVWLARNVTGAFRAVKIVRRASFSHDRPFEREFEGILSESCVAEVSGWSGGHFGRMDPRFAALGTYIPQLKKRDFSGVSGVPLR
jgi:serine/threonine protein kinase